MTAVERSDGVHGGGGGSKEGRREGGKERTTPYALIHSKATQLDEEVERALREDQEKCTEAWKAPSEKSISRMTASGECE